MQIIYLGHSAFLLKGSSGSVVTDPYGAEMMGKAIKSTDADIVTISHSHGDHSDVTSIGGDPLVLTMPGEYEKSGIRVQGFHTFHDKNQGADRGKNVMFNISIDGVNALHCGDLGHLLKADTIDEIGTVDVILIPVGGFYTINADEASDIVSKIEPSVVIPMHFNNPAFANDTNAAILNNMTPVDDFIQKMGTEAVRPGATLKISQSDLNEEEMKIVVLDIA